MHRLGADHPRNTIPADQHRPADDNPFIDAAHRRETQHAAVLHIGDEKSDLIHMRGQHQLLGGCFLALLKRNQVAERIGFKRADAFQLLFYDAAHASLISRNTGSLRKTFHQLNHGVPPPSDMRRSAEPYAPHRACRSPRPAYACI